MPVRDAGMTVFGGSRTPVYKDEMRAWFSTPRHSRLR